MPPIDMTVGVSAQPTGGMAFALTPDGRIPQPLLKTTFSYQPYTPTWVASGTAVSPGNAVFTTRYAQVGKVVHYWGQLTMGSTTTFGTGNYTFTLPVVSNANVANGNQPIGTAVALDTSGGVYLHAPVLAPTTSTFYVQYPVTYPTGTQAIVGHIVPWTFAVGDTIDWNIVYEAAA